LYHLLLSSFPTRRSSDLGISVFDQCIIHSLRKGYITAASTPMENDFGFVFKNCKLTGAKEATEVYLGRPWRPYAHTAFINTWMRSEEHTSELQSRENLVC